MVNRGSNTVIINDDVPDDAAEGQDVYQHQADLHEYTPSVHDGFSHELESTVHARQITTVSVSQRESVTTPAAETGVINAVSLSGESIEVDEAQDASRTNAERGVNGENMSNSETNSEERAKTASVLIIEDTPELVEILEIVLGRMGLNTAAETHGEKAFDRFVAMNPDVLLLDLALPDLPGWKVLEAIKERQRTLNAKMPIVIVMTAYGDATNRLVGKLHDVHTYLIKPFTADEVERVIWQALNPTTP
jgi:CheY-like chemotaxis protein